MEANDAGSNPHAPSNEPAGSDDGAWAGKVVAVVGATGGLGGGIAAGLERRGATVVRAGRRDADVVLDIRDSTAGDELVAHVRSAHGRLDGVVIASGIVAFGELGEVDDVIVEELVLTNALGPIWLARRVLPALVESGGFLVNLSGMIADTPMPAMSAYAASKAAVAAAWEAIRKETRRSGVRVLDARPPHTETGLATRAIAGTAPRMPQGLDPRAVAERIISGIEEGDRELAPDAFG